MKTRFASSMLVAIAALTIFSTQLTQAAKVVDVDATTLGVADGTTITTLSNAGTASDFTTNAGSVVTFSYPANSNAGVMIQGAQFNGSKMVSDSGGSHALDGNNPHTVAVWVYNPAIASEEALVSWGHRGGPTGSNMGFHSGTHGAFGAVGHWGGPDIGYGNNGADINPTAGQWAQLAYVYDPAEGPGTSDVYINGVLSNTDAHGTLGIHGADLIALGAESNNNAPASVRIPLSGTIARAEVWDFAMSHAEIQGLYDASSPLFVDGIAVPEPGSFVLAMMGLFSLFAFRRRRRRN